MSVNGHPDTIKKPGNGGTWLGMQAMQFSRFGPGEKRERNTHPEILQTPEEICHTWSRQRSSV